MHFVDSLKRHFRRKRLTDALLAASARATAHAESAGDDTAVPAVAHVVARQFHAQDVHPDSHG